MTTLQSGVINWQRPGYNSYSVGYLACGLAPMLCTTVRVHVFLPPSLPLILRTCSASWGDGRHGNLPRTSVRGCESGSSDVMLLAVPAHEGCSNLERGGGHRQCVCERVLCVGCVVAAGLCKPQHHCSIFFIYVCRLKSIHIKGIVYQKFCYNFSTFAHPLFVPNIPFIILSANTRKIYFEWNIVHMLWNTCFYGVFVLFGACVCIKKKSCMKILQKFWKQYFTFLSNLLYLTYLIWEFYLNLSHCKCINITVSVGTFKYFLYQHVAGWFDKNVTIVSDHL